MNEINHNLTLEREAELETTSGDRLRELAALNETLAQIVASNIAAPSDLLKKLAFHESEAVRKAVASNPNTPTEKLAASRNLMLHGIVTEYLHRYLEMGKLKVS